MDSLARVRFSPTSVSSTPPTHTRNHWTRVVCGGIAPIISHPILILLWWVAHSFVTWPVLVRSSWVEYIIIYWRNNIFTVFSRSVTYNHYIYPNFQSFIFYEKHLQFFNYYLNIYSMLQDVHIHMDKHVSEQVQSCRHWWCHVITVLLL